MTKREKIIVGATVAAIAWVGLDFLFGPRSGEPSAEGENGAQAPELATVLTQAETELGELRLDPVQERVMETVANGWRPNLFAPGEIDLAANTTSGNDSGTQALPAFTAYLDIGGKPIGIIDGNEYIEGEWLEDGSFKVERILPDRAELLHSHGDRQVTVSIEQAN